MVICGFYNVCRHRGAELVPCQTGSAGLDISSVRLPVPIMRTYQLDGNLKKAPHLDVNPGDTQLHGVSISTWAGFVFVRMSDARDETLQRDRCRR